MLLAKGIDEVVARFEHKRSLQPEVSDTPSLDSPGGLLGGDQELEPGTHEANVTLPWHKSRGCTRLRGALQQSVLYHGETSLGIHRVLPESLAVVAPGQAAEG